MSMFFNLGLHVAAVRNEAKRGLTVCVVLSSHILNVNLALEALATSIHIGHILAVKTIWRRSFEVGSKIDTCTIRGENDSATCGTSVEYRRGARQTHHFHNNHWILSAYSLQNNVWGKATSGSVATITPKEVR